MAREDWVGESRPFFIDSYGRVHIGREGMLHNDLAHSLGISQHSSFASGYYVAPVKGLIWYNPPDKEEIQLVVNTFRGRGMRVQFPKLTFHEMYSRWRAGPLPHERDTVGLGRAKASYRMNAYDSTGMRRESREDSHLSALTEYRALRGLLCVEDTNMTRNDVIDALVENILTYGSVASKKARLEKKQAKLAARERDQHRAMIQAHGYDTATAKKKAAKIKMKLGKKPGHPRLTAKLAKQEKSARFNQSEIRKYKKLLAK